MKCYYYFLICRHSTTRHSVNVFVCHVTCQSARDRNQRTLFFTLFGEFHSQKIMFAIFLAFRIIFSFANELSRFCYLFTFQFISSGTSIGLEKWNKKLNGNLISHPRNWDAAATTAKVRRDLKTKFKKNVSLEFLIVPYWCAHRASNQKQSTNKKHTKWIYMFVVFFPAHIERKATLVHTIATYICSVFCSTSAFVCIRISELLTCANFRVTRFIFCRLQRPSASCVHKVSKRFWSFTAGTSEQARPACMVLVNKFHLHIKSRGKFFALT